MGRARACTVGLILFLLTVAVLPVAQAAPRCFGKKPTIVGTPDGDTLRGTNGPDVIVGLGDQDTIRGRGGRDLICGGRGGDLILGGKGDDLIRGDRTDDALFGGPGHDTLIGGRGFFEFMVGGPGDDRLNGSEAGLDVAGYAGAPGAVEVDLAAQQASGDGTDTLLRIDGVDGSEFDDSITGTPASEFLFGGPGNDTINSGGNAGDLESPATVQELRFDFLDGDGFLGTNPPGNDTITGGPGLNVVSYEGSATGVTANLLLGEATGQGTDTLVDIQAVIGSSHNDVLSGNDDTNLFEGRAGTDDINGRGGRDILVIFEARAGVINLGFGSGTGEYRTFQEHGPPTFSSFGYMLTGIEDVWGSEFRAETVTGSAEANRLFGLGGGDNLSGLAGDDTLDGGVGTDTLDGGEGTDACTNGETVTNCETPPFLPGGAEVARSTAWVPLSLLRLW